MKISNIYTIRNVTVVFHIFSLFNRWHKVPQLSNVRYTPRRLIYQEAVSFLLAALLLVVILREMLTLLQNVGYCR